MCIRPCFAKFLCLSLAFLPLWVWGQTRSPDEVVITGVKFSRFVLATQVFPSFLSHPKSKAWLHLIEKNLCWSGVFKLYRSQSKNCHTANDHLDMQLNIEFKKTGNPALKLTITDADGIALFDTLVPVVQNRLQELDVMEAVNSITEQITVQPGILGSTIAFTLKQPGYENVIAKVNTHGEKLEAVSNNNYISIAPQWDPRGDSILYTVVGRRGTAVIFDDLQGKPRALLDFKRGMSTGGTWSQDRQKIILAHSKNGNSDLYEVDLRSKRLTRLTRHPRIDTAPALSPDGDYLLFVSDRGGSEQVYLLYLPTQEVYRMTYTGSSNTEPAWSPDGRLIAYTKKIRGRDQIYIMDQYGEGGENSRPLLQSRYFSEQPAWSPDGRQVVFASKRGRDYKLYTVFLDGKGLRRVTNTPEGFEEKSPSWTLRPF